MNNAFERYLDIFVTRIVIITLLFMPTQEMIELTLQPVLHSPNVLIL